MATWELARVGFYIFLLFEFCSLLGFGLLYVYQDCTIYRLVIKSERLVIVCVKDRLALL